MNSDPHGSFQHMIDESLAGAIAAEREQSLRHHLLTCRPCQEYLSASNRVAASLEGFSFEVGPTPDAKALLSLRRRVKPAVATQPGRRPWELISLAAVVLTIGGSFVDLQFGNLIASLIDIQPAQLHRGLFSLWIVPSWCVFFLFPLLPWLSKAGTRRKEGIL